MKLLVLLATLTIGGQAGAREPDGLHDLLDRLTREGRFSGAVVVRDAAGIRFARGYGMADPFSGRAFTPDTPVDSGSLAKPVTAAAVLRLAMDGKISLGLPVRRYLPEYPHERTTVRQLLAHSAGLAFDDSPDALAGKDNAALLAQARAVEPLFEPGSAFTYCNLCYSTLALLIERVSGQPYLEFVRASVALPPGVTLRPARLADWKGRAIGYRRTAEGGVERADSYDNELFYGTANLSISAAQLAHWGSEWWGRRLAPIRTTATASAIIAGSQSGLSWGNWYCAPSRRQCHYLGHHEGFHHLLYWDVDRKIAVAMVTNNSLAPALHQPLQRALVRLTQGSRRPVLEPELERTEAEPGRYRTAGGAAVILVAEGFRRFIVRRGLRYPAYPVGGGVRYVPGLDLYLSADRWRCVRLVTLYDDVRACR